MSYAVLHIMKASGSCTAIARHIERSTQPDNAHVELRYLNRDDFIKYPDGVDGLGEAIQHRLDHAGLTRKIGKNQVLALNVLLSSDGDALRRLAEEGRLNDWAESSVRWAKETFGEEASDSNAKKRYRTKSKDGPRLSTNDIMTRENLTRFQDTYADTMECFGLERGIRGSEARYVDQHEYYRQCQIKKKDLEQDVAKLSTQKKKLSREKTSLETDNRKLEVDNRYLEGKHELYKETNERLKMDCETLTRTKRELIATNNTLVPEVTELVETHDRLVSAKTKLSEEVESLELRKMRSALDTDLAQYKAEIERYCPDVPDLIVWGRYCTHIGFPDQMIQRILAQQSVVFSGKLYSPEHEQKFSTEHSDAKLERDPKEKHRFILTIDGVSVFQWFRNKAKELLAKLGIKPKEPKRGPSLGR